MPAIDCTSLACRRRSHSSPAGYTRCAPRTLLRSLLRADGGTGRGGQDVRRSEGEGILVMRSSWRLFGLQACALSSRPIITAIPTPLPLLFPGLSIDERGTAGASHVSGRHADPQASIAPASSQITHHDTCELCVLPYSKCLIGMRLQHGQVYHARQVVPDR